MMRSIGKPCLYLLAILSPLVAAGQSVAAPNTPFMVAAGSLREVMTEMTQAYHAQGGALFNVQYGPSGNLRKEIATGKKVDVFASADVKHTDALAQAKILGESQVFAHNDLCVVARQNLGLDANNLIRKLMLPTVRVATSTPKSDPMGDYTWQFFRKAESQVQLAFQTLDHKALKLSGATAPKPGEKLPYVQAFENNQADVYVMYCTNAVTTMKSVPNLTLVRIPDELNVRSAYGIAAHPASTEGERFKRFVLSADGQQILKKYGFN